MKKYIAIAITAAVLLLLSAIVLVTVLGPSSEIQGTTGTGGTTSGTTAGTAATTATTTANICDISGRGHVYVDSICGICGAEEPTSEEYLDFRLLSDGTYSVGKKGLRVPERLIIPSYYNRKPVTVIRTEAFFGGEGHDGMPGAQNPKYVYIPESVTEIGDSAFENCEKLQEIVIASNELYIGKRAFAKCRALEKAVFECDVISGSNWLSEAFYNCTKLETIEFHGSIIGGKLSAPGFISTFMGCRSLKNVILPMGTAVIGENAFYDCSSLEKLEIPDTVTSINAMAFAGCENLALSSRGNVTYDITAHRIVNRESKAIIWQNDAEPIPEDGSITAIANDAFAYNDKITEYKIPSVIMLVEKGAFKYCENLKSVVWESTCWEIPETAFDGCKKLESISINAEIEKIGYGAFRRCRMLGEIELPDTVTLIDGAAFSECDSMKSFTVPRGVRALYSEILYGCDMLECICIHSGVTRITEKAFIECPFLMDIYYGGTIEEWQAISKSNLKGATIVHCTDGDTKLESSVG